jgi:type II secretory pathway pseudopilin PulG
MTFQISRRGKQYLETAQTLLRAAQTMTDSAIADQLKALPTTTSGEQRKLRIDAAKVIRSTGC